MSFLLANWMLILVALVSGGMLLAPMLRGGGGVGGLTPAGAVQLINRDKAVVIDVCEPGEYAAGHVVGARSIPLADLEAKLPGAVKNKATPLVLVCASGMRSSRAVAVARKLGYENAQSLSGGMKSWREANLPIEKA
ncbi:rhodanese-like domain-containing protein [Ottowia sp.]|uniref:rhodanese-like domain-containing protein n=1 Tax=Ottowia sp. TaxID=1898956 RepID=UPI002BD32CDB|nr:rhodanese-like domain-containing protein [Ottowia sp.]HOB67040.1 rhodanese-like domain-containing protein [Ottowia sp.]HPZ55866.1 rhodanese-like domain-containing protein [Ottowia sp.]HQD49174.1 rhodanese-like domain-containing protein [Ottowia sp.]